jgi:hypothetical protein
MMGLTNKRPQNNLMDPNFLKSLFDEMQENFANAEKPL